ncbi:M24 family metallopeptidase [Salibacterium halotolerans]|uniref:Xaa-Pro aminopeptidase n=1 Tax=Salibacterium halotolerans TaxID=1884432 RepID=A0A1I5W7C1_9BACI|nr:Xaa-Pro peptidase family protein [Salibacterium halotolerans]SFQ15648.1 Xaa-Pro aminopeptidase [Salibacterium halotolerans]
MSIPAEKVRERLHALRSRMEKKHIQTVILWDPDNQYYFSGFKAISYSRPIVYWIYEQQTAYIIPELEDLHAEENAYTDSFHVYHERYNKGSNDTSFLDPFIRLLQNLPSDTRIGVEYEVMPAYVYQAVLDHGHDVVDIGEDIIDLRSVKDEEEIKWLDEAGRLSDVALDASFRHLKTGMSELEFDSYGDQAFLQAASEKYPEVVVGYENWTCSGIRRSAMPHLHSSTRTFESGDPVVHSRQVWINGYRAENERTFLFKDQATEEQKKLLKLAVDAQQAGMQAVKPGVRACDVDLAAYEVIKEAGFEDYIDHRIGHGLGLSEHEEPYLRFDNERILKEGMVYTIEPGIYVPGVGGFRHSDTVIVTADGSRSITHYPRSYEEMLIE